MYQRSGDINSTDPNGSGILRKLPAHNVDGGGFSRAVYSQKGEQFAFFHAKAQILHRLYVTEVLAQMFDLNNIIQSVFLLSVNIPNCAG